MCVKTNMESVILQKAYGTTVLWMRAISSFWKSSQFFHHNETCHSWQLQTSRPAVALSWYHVTILCVTWQDHYPGGFDNLSATTCICSPEPCETEMML